MRNPGSLVGLAFLFAAAAHPATAAVFVTSASFNAATTGLTAENYGSYSAGDTIGNGGTLGALSYSFITSSGLGGVITNDYNSFTGLSLAAKQVSGPLSDSDFFYSNEGFTVTLPTPVTAIGFFANVNNPDTFTLSTSSGVSTTQTITAYDTDTFNFIGVTSATPFQSATFISSDYNVPEIEYGTAIASGVPEPSTWALMLIGFGALGYLARRTNRHSYRTPQLTAA